MKGVEFDVILQCFKFLDFEELLTVSVCNKTCHRLVYELIERYPPGLTKYLEQCLFYKFLHLLIEQIYPIHNEIFSGVHDKSKNIFIWRYFVNLEEILPFVLSLDDPMLDFKRDSVKCHKPHFEDLNDGYLEPKDLYKKNPDSYFDLMDTILTRFVPEWCIFKGKWYYNSSILNFTRLFVADICTVCLYEKSDLSKCCFMCLSSRCRNPWKNFNVCRNCAITVAEQRFYRSEKQRLRKKQLKDKLWDCPLMNRACECYSHAGQGCECPCHRNNETDEEIMECMSSDDETYVPPNSDISEFDVTDPSYQCPVPLMF